MFELTKEEYDALRCQNFTLKNGGRGQHSKYLPFAFTREGIQGKKSFSLPEIGYAAIQKRREEEEQK